MGKKDRSVKPSQQLRHDDIERKYYKSSGHGETNIQHDIQDLAYKWLALPGIEPTEQAKKTAKSITGFDFSFIELKALDGLMKILASTDMHKDEGYYMGHGREEKDTFLGERMTSSVIITTWKEIFDICEVPRGSDGKLFPHQKRLIRDAIKHSLTQKRTLIYRNRKTGSVLYGEAMPISIFEAYSGMNESEMDNIEKGKSYTERNHKLHITFHPIFLMGMKSFYTMIPYDLFRKHKEFFGEGCKDKAPILFIRWLLMFDLQTFKKRRDSLMKILGFQARMKARQWSIIEKRMNDCFEFAKYMGYLKDWKQVPLCYEFQLNPETCPKLKRKLERIEEAQEKKKGGPKV